MSQIKIIIIIINKTESQDVGGNDSAKRGTRCHQSSVQRIRASSDFDGWAIRQQQVLGGWLQVGFWSNQTS